jgi:predicted amidohydrolase
MIRTADSITVAAGQIQALPMSEASKTLDAIDRLIEKARHQRLDLLVLPECAYPAYLLGSIETYRAADLLTPKEYIARLQHAARRGRFHIVTGLVEDTGDRVYNAAVWIDRDGQVIGRHRKSFLWDLDNQWYAPGEEISVFDTDLGKAGMIICAETRCPEIVATLAAKGAQLIAMPTCWINMAERPREYKNPQLEFLMAARAREFGVPFVCANKFGVEWRKIGYCGRSVIVRSDGTFAAEAPGEAEALIVSQLRDQRTKRVWINARCNDRITSDAEPIRPLNARTMKIAAVPGVVMDEQMQGEMGQGLFEPLRDAGVDLAILNVSADTLAEQVELRGNAFDMRVIAFPSSADLIEVAGGTVACISHQAIGSFAAARAAALQGATMLAVFDAPPDIPLLRTRAVENRVFLIAVGDRRAIMISPNGQVLAESFPDDPRTIVAQIAVAEACDKNVYQGTDIWRQRRPNLYRFRQGDPSGGLTSP